ncbi:MAG TPA: hypothetical protein ENK97_00485 [Campylobacteraceae bacterium]|nr:hypothetical protein [Campylobacteraceae bacterium]
MNAVATGCRFAEQGIRFRVGFTIVSLHPFFKLRHLLSPVFKISLQRFIGILFRLGKRVTHPFDIGKIDKYGHTSVAIFV